MKSSFDNSFFKWIPNRITTGDLIRESLNTVRRINEFGASDNQGNVYAPGCYDNWLKQFDADEFEAVIIPKGQYFSIRFNERKLGVVKQFENFLNHNAPRSFNEALHPVEQETFNFIRELEVRMEQKEIKKPGEYGTKNSPKPGEKKIKKDEPEKVETVSLSDVLPESFGKVLVNNEAIHPLDKPLYDQWLKAVTPSWKEQLTERELMEVSFAKLYVEKFNHGVPNHLNYTVIAKLVKMLEDK